MGFEFEKPLKEVSQHGFFPSISGLSVPPPSGSTDAEVVTLRLTACPATAPLAVAPRLHGETGAASATATSAIGKVWVVGARGAGAGTRPSVRGTEATLPRDVEQVGGQLRRFPLQLAEVEDYRLASRRRDS